MKDPRPTMISARPPERRSTVENSWNTRIGSSELSTVTALVSRMRVVRAAAAASTTAGVGDRELGSMVLPDAEHVETDLLGELDLLHEIVQPLLRADLAVARVREREDADLHPHVLAVRLKLRFVVGARRQ